MVRLTLFNRSRSTCSHRVRIVLALKGLDYEYVPVGKPSDEHSGVAYQARSPTGYVSCLVVDGVAYVESVAIIERLRSRTRAPPLAHQRTTRACVDLALRPAWRRALRRSSGAVTIGMMGHRVDDRHSAGPYPGATSGRSRRRSCCASTARGARCRSSRGSAPLRARACSPPSCAVASSSCCRSSSARFAP